jgi:hypothetical protein
MGAVLLGPIVNLVSGHSYLLLSANTWTASEAEAVALGGHLATVNDVAENGWIAATFPEPYYYLWIGLNDAAVEGQFVWSSGQPVTYLNWYPGQPDNYDGGEDYVLLYNFDSGFQEWNDDKDITLSGVYPIYGLAEIEPPDTTHSPPSLIAQPQGQTNFPGTTATFRVSAMGSVPLHYQWESREGALTNATNATLVLHNATTNQAGSYRLVVTNIYGRVTSSNATLTLLAPQPVRVGLKEGNHQLTLSWPPGLSSVQPQKATSLSPGAFQNFGLATTASNLLDTKGTTNAFYRLLFLAPLLTAQPVAKTVAAGTDVTLGVSATGTAPISYQWRKDGAALIGQTTNSLSLPAVTILDAGSYTVVLANRAGSVTSSVAAVTVTNTPQGIYMGKFAEEIDNGGFAVLVKSNLQAVWVSFSDTLWIAAPAVPIAVAKDDSFKAPHAFMGLPAVVAGKFNQGLVSGVYTNEMSWSNDFSGVRKSGTGIHQADAGYYAGTFDGDYVGDVFAILAADGTIFFYGAEFGNGDGGYGTINAANTMSATTSLLALVVTGTLDRATHQVTGTYNYISDPPGVERGSFTLIRATPP